MHRIDSAHATEEGLFTEGDPLTGTPATTFTGSWCNAVQEELVGVIELAGLELDKNDNTQMAAALQTLYGQDLILVLGIADAFMIGGSAALDDFYYTVSRGSITKESGSGSLQFLLSVKVPAGKVIKSAVLRAHSTAGQVQIDLYSRVGSGDSTLIGSAVVNSGSGDVVAVSGLPHTVVTEHLWFEGAITNGGTSNASRFESVTITYGQD